MAADLFSVTALSGSCVLFFRFRFILQEVAVKECLAAAGRPLRKTASVPNIHNVSQSFPEWKKLRLL